MVSSREGFSWSKKATFGQGRADEECTAGTSLKTSGEDLFGLFGGEEYKESSVEWNMFKNISGLG